MDFRELVETLWRRKLVVLLAVLIWTGIAFGVLSLTTPQYESTSTLVLRPKTANDFSFFFALDSIVPIYANAAATKITYEKAAPKVSGGLISPISVETFRQTPIVRIKARDPDPERARASAQAISEALLEQVRAGEVGIPSLRVNQIDLPSAASEPVYPRTGLTLAVAALLGFAFGVAAALLRENLTTKVETADQLASLAGVPCFAEIPNESAVPRARRPEDLVENTRLRAVSEALRDLRTNLLFSAADLRSVVVTSPEGSHGKTTTSFGLAVTFARAGTRTVLVDADLRKGRIAELLQMRRTPGLGEALRGAILEDCIQATSLPTLSFVAGGALETDPGELLMAEFPSVLHDLKQLFEVIVIDTTPLVPVNDARIIASSAEAVLVVASAESVTRRQIRSAIERLSLVSVAPAAVVLNNSRAAAAKGYYGYLDEPRAQPPRRRRMGRRGRRAPARP
jgi:capsular exopolysaccharide synthesis family protein